MSERVDRAKALFLEGYNCSQSIVGAFCEDVGLDFETAIKMRDRIAELKKLQTKLNKKY